MAEDTPGTRAPGEAEPGGPTEPELPPYVIEGARSGRSRCKTCRRTIAKGALRIGVLIEGPYGTGYMWHHLNCLARRRIEQVEEAYAAEAWREAKEPPEKVPALDELRALQDQAEKRRQQRKELPWAEVAPSGRSRCKHCEEPIDKGALRVVVGREVEFGGQVRVGPIKVHPGCVRAVLEAPDCPTEAEGLAEVLRQHSELDEAQLRDLLRQIG